MSEAQVGVDEYHAEILPEDKARFVEEERAKGHTVIMLGNGINDSPALLHNLSTLGISLRSMTNLLGTAPDPKN